MTDHESLVSEKEMERLVLALARSGKPFAEAAAEKVLAWAAEIRIGYAMLGLALQGRKALSVNDHGEVEIGDNQT